MEKKNQLCQLSATLCQSWYSRWHLQHSNSERKFVLRLGSFRETTTTASPRSFPFSFIKKKKNKKKKKFKNEKISKGSNHLFKQVLKCGSLFLIVFCIQSSLKAVRVKRQTGFKEKPNNVFCSNETELYSSLHLYLSSLLPLWLATLFQQWASTLLITDLSIIRLLKWLAIDTELGAGWAIEMIFLI